MRVEISIGPILEWLIFPILKLGEFICIKGQIWEPAKFQQFQNLLIFWISIVLQIEKNSKNLLIFQVVKFWKFDIFQFRKLLKIFNLENSWIF